MDAQPLSTTTDPEHIMLVAVLILAALVPMLAMLGNREAQGRPARLRAAAGPARRTAVSVAAVLALLGASLAGTATALEQDGTGLQAQQGASGVTLQAGATNPAAECQALTELRIELSGGACGTVSGRVVDASGDGIRDVRLSIRSLSNPYASFLADEDYENLAVWDATTDDDGSYTIGPINVGYGAFVISASAPGDRYANENKWLPVVTDGGPGNFPVDDIILGRGGTVSGSLRDPDGAVPSPTEVELCLDASGQISGGEHHLGAFADSCIPTQSDADGNFSFEGIAANTYLIGIYDRYYYHFGPTLDGFAGSVSLEDGEHKRLGELVVVPSNYPFEGAFYDDEGSFAEASIDAVARRRIVAGTECGRGRICPDEGITRAVMAVWFGRAILQTEPQWVESSRFVDVQVDGDHAFEAAHIERFADQGITTGCATAPLRYCPDLVVTRAEMATFIQRALDLDIPAEPAGFTDVDRSNVHAGAIDALHAAGITTGCATAPLRYCPNQRVTRGQMATFIHRLLPRADDRLENEVLETAVLIEPGTRIVADSVGGPPYRFEVPAGGFDGSAIIEIHSSLFLYIRLTRSVAGAPDELAAFRRHWGGDDSTRLVLDDLAAGWYLIEISGDSSGEGAYELSMTLE